MVKEAMRRAAATGRHVASGFATGLANTVSITGGMHRPFPKIERDPNRAFAKDWEKLGGDMRRAVDTATAGGSRKR